MRKLILFIILFFALTSSYAQVAYNFSTWGIGVFGGINRPYIDLKKANQGTSFDIVGYYNLTPYVPVGLEIQAGGLSGGNILTDPATRQFNNQYKAILLHADYGLGEIIDYEVSSFASVIKDFYGGTGIGVILNHMKFIQRTQTNGYRFPGKDNSMSVVVPLRIGYEFKFYNSYNEPFMGLNIQYIHNITFNEELDGYTDPPDHFKNNSPDQYRQIQIGLKFNFGDPVPYAKRINY